MLSNILQENNKYSVNEISDIKFIKMQMFNIGNKKINY